MYDPTRLPIYRQTKEKMRHGSLFSGIGGFDLAAEWMGWINVFQVEKDQFCQEKLEKNFPNVLRYGDIKQFNGTKYQGAIDIITGGFPCQPFSLTGKQLGTNDPRYLWPEMLRVIREIRPRYIVGENVSGAWQLVDKIKNDLEAEGYESKPVSIGACSVGADHIRKRYWFIANSISRGSQERLPVRVEKKYSTHGNVFENEAWYSSKYYSEIESMRNGAYNGVPDRVDRIKALGNAIVPQVAFEIFKAIERVAL